MNVDTGVTRSKYSRHMRISSRPEDAGAGGNHVVMRTIKIRPKLPGFSFTVLLNCIRTYNLISKQRTVDEGRHALSTNM